MSNIDKQALKPGLYAILFRNNWDGEGDTYEMLASLDTNLIWHNYETGKELFEYEGDEILKSWLLNDCTTTDALEAAEKRIAEQREYYEGVIADGSKRIAELEARTVTLPDRKSEIFWPGDAYEFDSLGYVIAVKSAIHAAGIQIVEEGKTDGQ